LVGVSTGETDVQQQLVTGPQLALARSKPRIIGGAVPVPGGMGVAEAGLIAGLTAAGIPQDQAVAAVLMQRAFTSYLPPIWGWLTLAWMRRREYI
jgi:uncharacterized membrane protein YbhN (UPF0104 family)